MNVVVGAFNARCHMCQEKAYCVGFTYWESAPVQCRLYNCTLTKTELMYGLITARLLDQSNQLDSKLWKDLAKCNYQTEPDAGVDIECLIGEIWSAPSS